MWNQIRKSLTFFAVLGGCWAFIFNPNGVLDTLKKTWPFINTEWLTILGIVVLTIVLILYPIQLGLDILRSIKSRSKANEYRIRTDIQSNLSTLQLFLEELLPDNRDIAQADVILNKLISQKVIHPKINDISPERRSAYVAYVSNVIDQFSLEDAIASNDQIFGKFVNITTE